ncbi:MAG: DUF2085 domain-containing protein [Acidobacteriota bacterium]
MSAAVVEGDSLGSESTHASRAARTVWAILAVFAVALVASILAAPLAQSQSHPQFAAAIYKAYSFVCHQFSDRSFHLAGHPFAVCSRCTGLYSGFAVAVLAYPLLRSVRSTDSPPRLWLILAAVPLAVDFALGYFSIWQNNHLSRFSTGALLGAAAVFYIIPGLVDLTSRFGRRRLHASQ